MSVLAQIGYLITQHDDGEVKFTKCEGCSTCEEITRLRKIIDPESDKKVRKSKVKPKTSSRFYNKYQVTKEDIYECIMQGMKRQEIAEKFKIPPATLSKKITVWFPNYKELKVEASRQNLKSFSKEMLTHEMYKEMKRLNISDTEIAKYYGITRNSVEYRAEKWRNEEKISELIKSKTKQPPAGERIDSLIQENANLEVELHEKEITIRLLEDRIAELESNNRYKTVG